MEKQAKAKSRGTGLESQILRRLRHENCIFMACLGFKVSSRPG